LGLVGMLAVAGCGGSSSSTDGGVPGLKDTGTGPGPDAAVPATVVKVSPSSLNFGEVDVGDTSQAKSVAVTIVGTPIMISPTLTGAGFILDSATTCGTAVAPTCTIAVDFAPGAVGGASGVLTVAPGITVALSGTSQAKIPGGFSLTSTPVPATVLVNQALPVVVTITASGPLTDLACLPSGNDLTADPTQTNCTAALAASASCTYGYIFKSATAGAKTDSIVCSSALLGQSKPVSVILTVVTPASLAISPPTGSFSAGVGLTSAPIVFNLANAGGSASGTLSAPVLAGANADQFAITDNKCLVPLAPLSTCAITVAFKPTAAGTKTATISITDASAPSTPASATLSGVAITGPTVAVTGPADLGIVTIGSSSTPGTYTVTNSGQTATAPLAIAVGDAQFVIGTDSCTGAALAPTKTCTLTVTFTPAAGSAGVVQALLTASAAGALMGSLQIQGTASPMTPAANLTMTPPTLDFGTIGVGMVSAPQTFVVTNIGGLPTAVLLPPVKNDSTSSVGGASQFDITTTCSGALNPLDTCDVVVTFKPTIAGSASATVTVSDGVVSTQARTVVGIALTRPGLTLSCVPTFTVSNTQTVVGQTSSPAVCTVTNISTSAQATGTLTAAATGDFAITTNNCSASLAPGLACTFSLVFKPTVKGERDGTITVTGTNGGAANQNLAATGLGVIEIQEFPVVCSTATHTTTCVPTVGATPLAAGNYDFGSLPVGANSSGQTPPTTLALAVFVRGQVGNLAVTDVVGTPADFSPEGSPMTSGPLSGVSLCNLTTPYPTVTVSTSNPFCVVLLDFNPQSKGAKTGSVTALAGDGTKDTASFKGNATGPIYIVPSALTFSAVALGQAGTTTMTLSVCNAAATDATGAKFTMTGSSDFVVTVDNVTAATIPAGGCKTLNLILDVPATETATALTATVSASATVLGAVESDTATLSGTVATGAKLTATLGGEFSDTAITAVSQPVTVTVGNSGGLGTSPVTFTIPTGSEFFMSPAPGTQSQGTCVTTCTSATSCNGIPLAAGGTCTLKLWFSPTGGLGVGGRTDTLTVSTTNAGKQILTLLANATSQITVSPATLTISTPAAPSGTVPGANAGTVFKTITVTNNGAAISAGDLGFAFTDAVTKAATTNFAVKTNNCAGGLGAVGSVSPAPTCTIDLQMSVPASALPGNASTRPTPLTASAIMKITVGATSQSTSTVLTGTTAGDANVQFTAATNIARDFGVITPNSTSAPVTYTLKNFGGFAAAPLTFTVNDGPTAVHTPIADFPQATGTGNCVSSVGTTVTGTALAPGQSCDIVLAFSPTAATTSSLIGDKIVVTTPVALLSETFYATKGATAPYIVEATGGKAPYDYGTTGGTATLKICNPSGGSAFTFATSGTVGFALDAVNVGGTGVAGEFATAALPTTAQECSFTGSGPVTGLNPGDCCLFGAKWTPAAIGATNLAGTRAVTVTVAATPSGASSPMTLYAHRLIPASLTAVPSTVAFGNAVESVVSPKLTVVVTNTGEVATGAVVAATSNSTQLQIVSPDTTCNAVMNPGDTCNLVLATNPTALAGGGAVATVATAISGTLETVSVPATWTGVLGAAITPSPATAAFGNSAVGVQSATIFTIALTNATSALATGPLSFKVDDADFAVKAINPAGAASTDCGNAAYLVNGLTTTGVTTSCNVFVTFTPMALASAAKTGHLIVTSSAAATVNVALTGTATAALTLTGEVAAGANDLLMVGGFGGCVFTAATATVPAACSFATGASITETSFQSETFTFTNAGPATGLLVANLSGTNAADFRIVKDTCTGQSLSSTTPVASPNVCAVTVRFAPATTGTKAASLTVAGTPGDSVTVTMSATGNP
jgi:hypothetical protein